MSERSVGAAVVMDPDGNGPGIITERDILRRDRRRAGPRPRAGRRAPDARRRLRRARLVAGGGRRGDGARRLPPSDRAGRGRDGRASSRSATSCAAGPRTARSARCRAGGRRLRGARPRGAGVRVLRRSARPGYRAVVVALPRRVRRSAVAVRFERELVDFAARVFDPADHAARASGSRRSTVSSMNVVMPTSASVIPTAVSSGRIARAGEVDLLADGRDLGVERAHET